jgi:undecaprenyl pyrophosphate phosphatase UppP
MSRPSLTIEGPYTTNKRVTVSAEFSFWFCVVMAFAAGFLTAILLGVK